MISATWKSTWNGIKKCKKWIRNRASLSRPNWTFMAQLRANKFHLVKVFQDNHCFRIVWYDIEIQRMFDISMNIKVKVNFVKSYSKAFIACFELLILRYGDLMQSYSWKKSSTKSNIPLTTTGPFRDICLCLHNLGRVARFKSSKVFTTY